NDAVEPRLDKFGVGFGEDRAMRLGLVLTVAQGLPHRDGAAQHLAGRQIGLGRRNRARHFARRRLAHRHYSLPIIISIRAIDHSRAVPTPPSYPLAVGRPFRIMARGTTWGVGAGTGRPGTASSPPSQDGGSPGMAAVSWNI